MKRIFGLTAFLLTLTLLPVQAQEKTVILGGDTIAITVNYEGVYVSGMISKSMGKHCRQRRKGQCR